MKATETPRGRVLALWAVKMMHLHAFTPKTAGIRRMFASAHDDEPVDGMVCYVAQKVRPPNLEVAETPSANAVGGAAKQLIV